MEIHQSYETLAQTRADDRYHVGVTVRANYLPHESAPSDDRFVFAYTVTITNRGKLPVRLMRRRWEITDANGKQQHVEGAGVVGEQPKLGPGQAFRYTSAAMLSTTAGTMEGGYSMIAEDGHSFEADIPLFGLTTPAALH